MTSFGPPPPRGRRPWFAIVALPTAVVLGIVAGFLYVGVVDRPGTTTPSDSPSAHSTPSAASTTPPVPDQQPYDGLVAPITPLSVSASCTAKDAKDDGGHTVTYAPGNTVDGRASTAWRCNGSGTGQTLTIVLPPNSRVAQLGLVNGYAKIDPTSKVHRYAQYRRILQVSWAFPDGKTFDQNFSDAEDLQPLRIPIETADKVTLTIRRSSAPGQKDSTFNAVLISEIGIATPA